MKKLILLAFFGLFFEASFSQTLSEEKRQAEISFYGEWPGIFLDLLFNGWGGYIAFTESGKELGEGRYFLVIDTINNVFIVPSYSKEKHEYLASPYNVDSLSFNWKTSTMFYNEEGRVVFSVQCEYSGKDTNFKGQNFFLNYYMKNEEYGFVCSSELKKI